MRQQICLLFIVGVAFTITGCDAEKVKELSTKVEDLEKKNQELQDVNKKLEIDLAVANSELGKANETLKKLSDLEEKLGASAKGILDQSRETLKGIGEGLKAAKELGLPELKGKDVSLDDLLDKTLGKEKKKSPGSKKSDE